MYFKPFISQTTAVQEEAGGPQTTPIIQTIFSRTIDPVTANNWKLNYATKPLPGLKTAENKDILGFSFDVNDIRKMIFDLNRDDIVHISFALTEVKNGSYTLIMAPATKQDNGEYKLKHHEENNVWLEYSKPCPDECPQSED